MSKKTWKDWSKLGWLRSDEEKPSTEQIQVGCLQRIADASELIAQNYQNLITERDRYEHWFREERDKRKVLERKLNSHKGSYTRLKNKSKVPQCERCGQKMSPQFYEDKITWWTCESCADESDRATGKTETENNL